MACDLNASLPVLVAQLAIIGSRCLVDNLVWVLNGHRVRLLRTPRFSTQLYFLGYRIDVSKAPHRGLRTCKTASFFKGYSATAREKGPRTRRSEAVRSTGRRPVVELRGHAAHIGMTDLLPQIVQFLSSPPTPTKPLALTEVAGKSILPSNWV